MQRVSMQDIERRGKEISSLVEYKQTSKKAWILRSKDRCYCNCWAMPSNSL